MLHVFSDFRNFHVIRNQSSRCRDRAPAGFRTKKIRAQNTVSGHKKSSRRDSNSCRPPWQGDIFFSPTATFCIFRLQAYLFWQQQASIGKRLRKTLCKILCKFFSMAESWSLGKGGPQGIKKAQPTKLPTVQYQCPLLEECAS